MRVTNSPSEEKRKRTKYYQEKPKPPTKKEVMSEFEPMLDDNIRLESEAIDEAIQEKTGGWNVEIKCRSRPTDQKDIIQRRRAMYLTYTWLTLKTRVSRVTH